MPAEESNSSYSLEMERKSDRGEKESCGGARSAKMGSKCDSYGGVEEFKDLHVSEAAAEAKSSGTGKPSGAARREVKMRELDRELEDEADAEFEALMRTPASELTIADPLEISPRAKELMKGLRM